MTAEIEIMRRHFARMWPQRHDAAPFGAFTRASLRDNIRGQRSARARVKKEA